MVVVEEKVLKRIVEGNVVVVVRRRGCCMSYIAHRLLQELRANRTICEISEGFAEKITLMDKIANILSGDDKHLVIPLFLVVFIGGKLVSGLDRLIAIHISRELIPILKQLVLFALSGSFFLFFLVKLPF